MDKYELSQLKYLSREIGLLKKQIADAEYIVEARMTTDVVMGSSPTHPYVMHAIKISGVDIKDYERRVQCRKNSLKRRIDELMDKVAEIQEYIEAISDSGLRRILQCRYINGWTWEQIESDIGISQSTAKRKFRKWFENGI